VQSVTHARKHRCMRGGWMTGRAATARNRLAKDASNQ
jgi:hypothetical protein